MRISTLVSTLALIATAATMVGCPDDGTVSYECREGWFCFPADDIPSDLLGGGGDVAGGTDTQSDVGPDVVADTVDTGDGVSEVADTGDAGDTADTELPPPPPGTFGAACEENSQCNSGWCVEGPEGYVCTKTCELVCPSDWQCKGVSGGGADLTFLCLPRVNKVCVPCTEDFQCTGGKCLLIDGERMCGSACDESSECPDGYGCEEDAESPGGDKFCQPVTGSCQCSIETAGSVRTCIRDNAEGTCYGIETCDATVGWSGCTANDPTPEVCDGVDNNCNALIDDGVTPPGDNCDIENTFGTCAGAWICSDPDGQSGIQFWCTAQTPAEEVCDLIDNNCDGNVDELFKTNGVYVDQQNCGACGLSCDGAIPNAAGTSCSENGGQPRCEVVSCSPGYYLATPTTCLASTQTLCAPCETDANCEVPGDTCNGLDGAKFCGRDCSADNIYGFPEGECPPGYACNDLGGGNEQCQPESNSCQCLPGDDGNSRNCINSNDEGQCFGSQVCNSTLGWDACTADVPSAEICDGLDNDCNGQADDVTGRGQPCSDTNADGTCTGIFDCVTGAGDDLVCTAAVPAPEVCDYADNNCDGVVDEGFDQLYDSCSVGDGICQRFGFYICTADGAAEECNAVPADSEAETCNGLDDNCDGTTDEGFDDLGTICVAGSGACQNTGITVCDPSGATTTCSVSGGDNSPELCDGIDNDCNGLTDDGPNFVGIGQACILGAGTCAQPGTVQCNIGQDGVECNANPLPPGVETCDGLDNDCDGDTDAPLAADNCAQQEGVCADSVKTCGGLSGWLDCQNAEYGPNYQPTELACDGLDNDCDGETDTNLFAPACPLQDGVCAGSTQACGGTNGWTVCTAADYGSTYQEADEAGLCDGLDNNCNALVDEDFPLVGTVCQAGDGACAVAGTYVCNAAGDGVECSAVALNPTPELCNGIDDNCDGEVDNNVTNAPACLLTQGTCANTTQRCISGSFQACTAAEYGADYQTTEFSCDGVDNDCDGATDQADSDVVAPPCPLQLGVCNGGQQTCGGTNGWQPCTATQYGPNYADTEAGLCDNLDNNCDGDVDEAFNTKGGVCADGVGACSVTGTFVCTPDGTATECSVTAGGGTGETCNGIDDDCNGNVDDSVTDSAACALTQGVCAGKNQPCNGGTFQACTAAEYGATFQPGTEFSCDGLDNDCDGTVDDPADLTAPPCSNQAGVCAGSSQGCGGTNGWLACTPATFTSHSANFQANDEVGLCDNLDNDCDGFNDEDFPQKGLACTVGVGACAAVGTFVCNPAGTGVVCSASPGPAGTETCNGIDDDCVGGIDDLVTPTCPLQVGVCSGSRQVCAGASGLQACTAGNYGPNFEPAEVSCDGLDNDCDGDTDAADADLPNAPCANQTGVCSGSTRNCVGGGLQACSGAASFGPNWQADETVCDLQDNDCDGLVDEGFVNGGKYDQDTACGNCFTDCTDILNLPNSFGTCDSAPASPVCELNCNAGFFNLNGIVNDGCEFELRTDTIYVSTADGTDDATCGLGPNGTGGSNHPCATIDQGLDRAVALGGRDQVFVASGAYVEDVVVRNGTSLFGGYNPVTWGRDVAANLTSIFGNTAAGHRKAVRAQDITSATVVDGFAIYGESVSGGSLNSYAVWIRNSNSNFTLSNNLVFAGNGGRGTSGGGGSDGNDGGNGSTGANCIEAGTASCSGVTGSGGGGGSNGSCGGTGGGNGGSSSCPGNCDGTGGSPTSGGSNGGNPSGPGAAGAGGVGSDDWRSSNNACTTINTCGNPNEGGNADDGTNGGDGNAGQGCSAGNNDGNVSAGEWVGTSGSNGVNGTSGGGGGGGGVGGGMDDRNSCGWLDKLGGAGGGGGAGACSGTGAVGGGAGGGSFGIFFSASSPTNNLPVLSGNSITMGAGGNGGDGGLGGAGGLGGDGAAGGQVGACDQAFALGPGGRGGQGGDGGHGGGGGGGCGGVSFGIFADNNSSTPNWGTANTFGGTAAGGSGGQGGPSLGSSGTNGSTGAAANVSL